MTHLDPAFADAPNQLLVMVPRRAGCAALDAARGNLTGACRRQGATPLGYVDHTVDGRRVLRLILEASA